MKFHQLITILCEKKCGCVSWRLIFNNESWVLSGIYVNLKAHFLYFN